MDLIFIAVMVPVCALVFFALRKWQTALERLVTILIILGGSIFILGIAAFNPPIENRPSPLYGVAVLGLGISIAVFASLNERTRMKVKCEQADAANSRTSGTFGTADSKASAPPEVNGNS